MSIRLNAATLLAVSLLFVSCSNSSSESAQSTNYTSVDSTAYAEGFRLTSGPEGIRLLTISDPQHSGTEVYRYALVPKGRDIDASLIPEGYTPIKVPVERIICMTSLQLSNFINLGEERRVVGITSTRHLFNDSIKRQIKEGHTAKIGIEGSFDTETVLALDPELILISPFKRGGYEGLRESGVPMMPHLGYKETTPLGQAEWVKLVGILTGREDKARDNFGRICVRYDSLASIAQSASSHPVVMSGEFRGGNWYTPGGQSFLARLINDAGAEYFLKDNERSGGVTLDFETVYSQTENADYWRIVNSYEGDFSYKALLDQEPRYGDFKAFRNHGVVYCNMRTRPFYERMPMEPDNVLADLIHIFHPELLPDHTPVFYTLLNN